MMMRTYVCVYPKNNFSLLYLTMFCLYVTNKFVPPASLKYIFCLNVNNCFFYSFYYVFSLVFVFLTIIYNYTPNSLFNRQSIISFHFSAFVFNELHFELQDFCKNTRAPIPDISIYTHLCT